MKITPLSIPDVLLIEPTLHFDQRGFFTERFNVAEFQNKGLPYQFVQDNFSRSAPNVLRGLHYQKDPFSQGKLVTVLQGKIFDVAVDLRSNSQWRGQFVSVELSADVPQWIWIPRGFAHGFCVLGNSNADVLYKVDAPYASGCDSGVLWNDPELKIPWPVTHPIVSPKDQALGHFGEGHVSKLL